MLGKFSFIFVAELALTGANSIQARDNSGNPIAKPGLNELVPVGAPYTITWKPTTPGTVSLILLRGESTSLVKLATIAEGTPNTGTYSWTPPPTLEDDVTHYGINLTVDGTDQFQYSTQFGISNPNKKAGQDNSGSSSSSGSGAGPSSISSSINTPSISTTLAAVPTQSSISPVANNGTKSTGSPIDSPKAPTTASSTPKPSSPTGEAGNATTTGKKSTTNAAERSRFSIGAMFVALSAAMVVL